MNEENVELTEAWMFVFLDENGKLFGKHLDAKEALEEHLKSHVKKGYKKIKQREFIAAVYAALDMRKMLNMIIIRYHKKIYDDIMRVMSRRHKSIGNKPMEAN